MRTIEGRIAWAFSGRPTEGIGLGCVLCVRVEIRDTSLKIIKGQVRTEYKEYHRELDEEEPHPEVVNREREKKKGKEEGITATRCSLV